MGEVVLGKLVAPAQQRDAVHVAVIPMTAGKRLKPGEHVSYVRLDGTVKLLGIVDPFLMQDVEPGQVYWLCLLPGSVTGMRHHWTSMEFGAQVNFGVSDLRYGLDGVDLDLQVDEPDGCCSEYEPPEYKQSLDDMVYHREWLQDYARRHNRYDHQEEAFKRLIEGLRTGELFFNGTDLHGFYELDQADELRYHAEAYLKIRIDWERFSFSCSC